jgi:hypothetical protein
MRPFHGGTKAREVSQSWLHSAGPRRTGVYVIDCLECRLGENLPVDDLHENHGRPGRLSVGLSA